MRRAEFVGQAIAAHAVSRLQRSGRVVEARVNHSAVARAGTHAELRHRLKKKDIVPFQGERVGDRATHDPASDDDNVCLVHRNLAD